MADALGSSRDEDAVIGKKLAVRAKVAKELVATEVTYCNAISSIVSEFLRPSESILKKQYVTEIFSNIDQIHELHSSILPDLQSCVAEWNDDSCVAEVFYTLVPYLKLYKIYCGNYNGAVLRVDERCNSSSRFANLLATKKELVGFDLYSLLIQPIQRIPRYRLLFEELLKNTPEFHPDYEPMSKTLQSIQDVAVYVNESIRAKENRDKLLEIQKSLTGSKIPPIVAPGRIFMREGTLVKMCRREPKRRYFFLFNDLLVYCTVNDEQTYTFHRAIGLGQLRVDEIPDTSGMTNAFQILSNQKSFSVFAESPEEKKKWMEDINKAIQLCYKLQHKQATGKDADPDSIAPVWIPDKLLKNCMLCDVKFTTITRRHHCRKCGKLVCGSCSGKKYKLENIGKVCRVCDECYDDLSGVKKKENAPIRKDSQVSLSEIEAQRDLNRRATRKFGKKDLEDKGTYGSFIPEKEIDLNEVAEAEEDIESAPLTPTSKPAKRKKKKRRKRRNANGDTLRGTNGIIEYSEESSEESEGPDFPPPAIPAPTRNEEGFFDYESEEEDSMEFLPPPERLPPPIPIR